MKKMRLTKFTYIDYSYFFFKILRNLHQNGAF